MSPRFSILALLLARYNDSGWPVGAGPVGIEGGFHSASRIVGLSCPTPDVEIRYTVNGSEPGPSSTLYVSPLSVTTNRIIRARAFKQGHVPSGIVTHSYLIRQSSAKRSLPAIVLGGDAKLTFYGPNSTGGQADGEGVLAIKGGVYSGGDWNSGGDTTAFHYPLLRGRASEKPATLECLPLAGAGTPLRTEFGIMEGRRQIASQVSRSKQRGWLASTRASKRMPVVFRVFAFFFAVKAANASFRLRESCTGLWERRDLESGQSPSDPREPVRQDGKFRVPAMDTLMVWMESAAEWPAGGRYSKQAPPAAAREQGASRVC